MRSRGRKAGLWLVVGAAFVLSATPANAAECDPSVPPVISFTSLNGGAPPTEVAVGRRAEYALEDHSFEADSDWSSDDLEATVSFVVDGRTVFTGQVDTIFDGFWVSFDPGSRAGMLTATWSQSNFSSGQSCTKTIALGVSPIRGHPPRAVTASAELRTVERRWHGLRQPRNYKVWKEWVEFEVRPSRPKLLAATGPVEIRVTGAGRTYRLDLRDQFSDRRPRFVPPHRLRGRHRFRFTVRAAGRVLNRGRFTVKFTPRLEKRILEGTDAFWNVCINSTREVRSQNGRLYCWEYRYPATQEISGLSQSRH